MNRKKNFLILLVAIIFSATGAFSIFNLDLSRSEPLKANIYEPKESLSSSITSFPLIEQYQQWGINLTEIQKSPEYNQTEFALDISKTIIETVKSVDSNTISSSSSLSSFTIDGTTYCGFALICWIEDYNWWANLWGIDDFDFNDLSDIASGLRDVGFYTFELSDAGFTWNTFLAYYWAGIVLSNHYNVPFIIAVSTHGGTELTYFAYFVDHYGIPIFSASVSSVFDIIPIGLISPILLAFGIIAEAYIKAPELIVLAGWCQSFGTDSIIGPLYSGFPGAFQSKGDTGIMAGGWNLGYTYQHHKFWNHYHHPYFHPGYHTLKQTGFKPEGCYGGFGNTLKAAWDSAWHYDQYDDDFGTPPKIYPNYPLYYSWGGLDAATYLCPHNPCPPSPSQFVWTPLVNSKEVIPGVPTDLKFKLTNNGNDPQTFEIQANPTFPSNWLGVYPTSVTINPGQTKQISFPITVPADKNIRPDVYSLEVSLINAGSVFKKCKMQVSVGNYYALTGTLSTNQIALKPGESQDVSLTIENLGNCQLATKILVNDIPEEWYTIENDLPIVPWDSSEEIIIHIHPPEDALITPEMKSISIETFAVENPSVRDQKPLDIEILPFYKFEIIPVIVDNAGLPGEIIDFKIIIKNLGNIDGTAQFYFDDLPDYCQFFEFEEIIGWLEEKEITISVATEYTYWLKAMEYELMFNVKLKEDPSKVYKIPMTLDILPYYDLDVKLKENYLITNPGGIVEFYLDLQNIGNIADTYAISIEFLDFGNLYEAFPTKIQDDWTIIALPISISLENGELLENMLLKIQIPENWAGVEDTIYEFIICISSSGDLSLVMYVHGFIEVKFTKESAKNYVILELEKLKLIIQESPDEYWRDPTMNRKLEMINKLNELIGLIINDNFELAYDILLHDIKPKLTALKTDENETEWGNGVFKNSWVTSKYFKDELQLECNDILSHLNLLTILT